MWHPKKSFILIYLLLSFLPNITWAQEPDWSAYALLLKNHTTLGEKNGISTRMVNYQALQANSHFKKAIQALKEFDTKKLASREEKMSFYINAYNLLAIKTVVDHYPLTSIKDISGFLSPVWKQKVGYISYRKVSLDEIEHNILRNMNEPRIHFAIVCASMSCPNLRDTPYTAQSLDKDLDVQTKLFIHDSTKGVLLNENQLNVSMIFNWFKEDFKSAGGALAFIKKYKNIHHSNKINSYLDYDWSLNQDF